MLERASGVNALTESYDNERKTHLFLMVVLISPHFGYFPAHQLISLQGNASLLMCIIIIIFLSFLTATIMSLSLLFR